MEGVTLDDENDVDKVVGDHSCPKTSSTTSFIGIAVYQLAIQFYFYQLSIWP